LLGDVSGKVMVKSAHVALTPRLAAKDVRATVHVDQSELTFQQIDGSLAGGRVAGEMSFQRGAEGVTTHSKLRFASADLAELIRGGPPPLSGRLTADIDVEGTGRSPVALIGALKGSGAFTVQDARIQRLDPTAFDAVIRSVDQGLPIDTARIRDRLDQALSAGSLTVTLAEGAVAVADGQLRLANTMVRANGADLALGGSVVLTENAIDTRLALSGPAREDSSTHPEVVVTLRGPIDAPRRSLDVVAFSNWLALRAIEQKSKRIDALEAGRALSVDPPAPHDSPATASSPAGSSPAGPPRAGRTAPQAQPQPQPRSSTQSPAPNAGRATQPPQPLDLRPPAPRGNSLLETWFGR
jgi:hypothetical protein